MVICSLTRSFDSDARGSHQRGGQDSGRPSRSWVFTQFFWHIDLCIPVSQPIPCHAASQGQPINSPARLCLSSYKEQCKELRVKVRCHEALRFPPYLTHKERIKEENSTHQPPHKNKVTEAGLKIDMLYLVRAF